MNAFLEDDKPYLLYGVHVFECLVRIQTIDCKLTVELSVFLGCYLDEPSLVIDDRQRVSGDDATVHCSVGVGCIVHFEILLNEYDGFSTDSLPFKRHLLHNISRVTACEIFHLFVVKSERFL